MSGSSGTVYSVSAMPTTPKAWLYDSRDFVVYVRQMIAMARSPGLSVSHELEFGGGFEDPTLKVPRHRGRQIAQEQETKKTTPRRSWRLTKQGLNLCFRPPT